MGIFEAPYMKSGPTRLETARKREGEIRPGRL